MFFLGDFVSTEEGTGIVHLAPAFGEDDFNLSSEKRYLLLKMLILKLGLKRDFGKGKMFGKPVQRLSKT